jgi:hypothetical protein
MSDKTPKRKLTTSFILSASKVKGLSLSHRCCSPTNSQIPFCQSSIQRYSMKLCFSLFLSLLVVEQGSAFVVSSQKKSVTVGNNPLVRLREAASEESPSPPSPPATKEQPPPPPLKAIILDAFPEAADPKYAVRGPVGEGNFLVSRTGGPTQEELTDANLYQIIDRTASDLEVNTLVWKCLGYRFDESKEEWTPEEVFPKWKERFPNPIDFIGMQRVYSKDIDGPCLRNNQQLVRSIPVDNKQSYTKIYLKPFGFTGYKVSVSVSVCESECESESESERDNLVEWNANR